MKTLENRIYIFRSVKRIDQFLRSSFKHLCCILDFYYRDSRNSSVLDILSRNHDVSTFRTRARSVFLTRSQTLQLYHRHGSTFLRRIGEHLFELILFCFTYLCAARNNARHTRSKRWYSSLVPLRLNYLTVSNNDFRVFERSSWICFGDRTFDYDPFRIVDQSPVRSYSINSVVGKRPSCDSLFFFFSRFL